MHLSCFCIHEKFQANYIRWINVLTSDLYFSLLQFILYTANICFHASCLFINGLKLWLQKNTFLRLFVCKKNCVVIVQVQIFLRLFVCFLQARVIVNCFLSLDVSYFLALKQFDFVCVLTIAFMIFQVICCRWYLLPKSDRNLARTSVGYWNLLGIRLWESDKNQVKTTIFPFTLVEN
jgi:hypothetical protein